MNTLRDLIKSDALYSQSKIIHLNELALTRDCRDGERGTKMKAHTRRVCFHLKGGCWIAQHRNASDAAGIVSAFTPEPPDKVEVNALRMYVAAPTLKSGCTIAN